MQSRTRSMSIPAAALGTPSRSIWRLKSSEASAAIDLNAADEAAGVQDAVRVKGLFERAHDRKAGWGRSPDVEPLFDRARRRCHDDLALMAPSGTRRLEGCRGNPRGEGCVDQARRRLGHHAGIRWEGLEGRLECREGNDGPYNDQVLIGRRPIAGRVPKTRRNTAVLNPAAGVADDPGGLVPSRLDLPGITLQLEHQRPSPAGGQPAVPQCALV